jgi:hypothetical protein
LGCGSGSPWIDPIFGPTAHGAYWSATTDASDPSTAWRVPFYHADATDDINALAGYVRAVRVGS